MELVGNVKTYDWGKLGRESEVAQLAALQSSNFTPDDTTPYSELWMGDHTSGPSKIKSTQEDLGRFLAANGTELLGGQDKLTFLFKVLSIRKALSIQVHPNKQEAERLHAERPDVYKDPNHKPELAIALTPFLALCGFRPYQEIYELCSKLPPLVNLLGADNVAKITSGADGLRTCYEMLMTSPEKNTADCIEEISKNHSSILQENGLLEIFNKINNDFPHDVGLLSLFFLNLIRLKPGEAIFLGANEIHAYLEGDCIECMACSDNVVRAGLTPKYKDVNCLVRMLNYEGLPAESKLFRPQQIDNCLERFSPPVKDFAVEKLSIPKPMKEYKLKMEKYGAILLVLRGERQLQFADGGGLPVKRGSIVFIPGNVGEVISFVGMHNEDDFVGYIAKYNSL